MEKDNLFVLAAPATTHKRGSLWEPTSRCRLPHLSRPAGQCPWSADVSARRYAGGRRDRVRGPDPRSGPIEGMLCRPLFYYNSNTNNAFPSPRPPPATSGSTLPCDRWNPASPTPLSNQGFTWLIIMTHTNWNSYLATHQQKIEHRIGYYSCFVGNPDTHLFICLPSLLRHPLNNIRHVFIIGLVLFCITLFSYVSARQLSNCMSMVSYAVILLMTVHSVFLNRIVIPTLNIIS